ncbi:MAG: hypothetical protein AAGA96_19860 [Verrucomicrobiota bacterium]
MSRSFQATRWSLIQQAAGTDLRQREAAWQEFDRLYREPLLGFIRRTGWGEDEAEDLLQGFLGKLAERDWLKRADPERGKMRTFLLSKLKGHLSDARKYRKAEKRGGEAEIVEFDETYEGGNSESDLAFDREWAQAILHRALEALQAECEAKGKGEVFLLLRSQLTGDSSDRLREAAVKLGEREGALRMQLHRLRGRFRESLRSEVRETLLADEDVDEEMRYLARILG